MKIYIYKNDIRDAVKNHQKFGACKTAISEECAVAAAAEFYFSNQGKTDLTGLIYNGAPEFLRNFI